MNREAEEILRAEGMAVHGIQLSGFLAKEARVIFQAALDALDAAGACNGTCHYRENYCAHNHAAEHRGRRLLEAALALTEGT